MLLTEWLVQWIEKQRTTCVLGATQAEKSTINKSNLNAVSATQATQAAEPAAVPKACSLDDPDCEACQ